MKESLGTIPHGVTGAMVTKVGWRNDNSQLQGNEGPRYQRRRSSWGQGGDIDSALLNGRVDNDIQDYGGSPSRKIFLSISAERNLNCQVTKRVHVTASAHLNTMQRKGSMQGDNTFTAFQQATVGAVPTFIITGAFLQFEHWV